MKGYTVHLLFHLVAIVIGGAAGLAASLWWFGGQPAGLWLAIGALLVGVVLLALQLLYISRSQPPVPRYDPEDEEWDDEWDGRGNNAWDDGGDDAWDESGAEPVSSTREDLEPVPESEVPQAPPSRTDEETKKSARAALNEHWSSHPSTRRS